MKKKWIEKESIVAIIEKCICPAARVQHNVHMPVHSSTSGRTRQCDVVIRQGKVPRETITIVEVQDRSGKVEVNDYGGWVDKMREVGAQHLICVSKKGFPQSVKEKAKQSGGTVRLIEFREISKTDWPNENIARTVSNPTIEILDIKNSKFYGFNGEGAVCENFELDVTKRLVEYDGKKVSFLNLFIDYIHHTELKNKNEFSDGMHDLNFSFPLDESKMCIEIENKLIPISSFSGIISFKKESNESELRCNRYFQFDYGDDLAWLMEAIVIHEKKEKLFQQIVVPLEDGYFDVFAKLSERSA
jgi:hypothetical protein